MNLSESFSYLFSTALFFFFLFPLFPFALLFSREEVPSPGSPAPIFSLPDSEGTLHSLENFRGKWVVLYFYPKDDTPGCTKQACTFRDEWEEFVMRDVQVIGISVDSPESHKKFIEKYKLPFLLLSDEKGEVCKKYGSLGGIGPLKFAKRNTFLIDPSLTIVSVYLGVHPTQNPKELLIHLDEKNPPPFMSLTPEEFSHKGKEEGSILLHLYSPSLPPRETIPLAKKVSLDELKNGGEGTIPSQGRILLFSSYTDQLSRKGAYLLHKQGKKEIFVLKGGLEEWKKAGLPTKPF
jgi:peroxiredoxin Q/BCP